MSNLEKAHIAKSGNVMTPKGRLSYAQYLLKPQEDKKGNLKYKLALLIPKGYDLTALKNKMGEVALKNCDGDKKRAKRFVEDRILDPNDLPGGGKPMGEEFKDFVLIRATSDRKPDIVAPSGAKIHSDDLQKECYSGRWARATVSVYWFDVDTNKGVGIGLANVQLLDHDENIGVAVAAGEDEFGSAEEVEAGEESSDVDQMFG